jgi:hypothetical protein
MQAIRDILTIKAARRIADEVAAMGRKQEPCSAPRDLLWPSDRRFKRWDGNGPCSNLRP